MSLRVKYNLPKVKTLPSFITNGKVLVPAEEFICELNTVPSSQDYNAFPVVAEPLVGTGDEVHLIHGRSESHSVTGALGGTYKKVSTDGGQTWTVGINLYPSAQYLPFTGSIGKTQTGRLLLDFQEYIGAQVIKYIVWSDDDGATWSVAQRLTNDFTGGLIDGPSRPIKYGNDMIKAFYVQASTEASYTAATYKYLNNGETRLFLGYIYPPNDGSKFEEPCLATLGDSLLLAVVRADTGGTPGTINPGAYTFWSPDGARWTERRYAFPSVGKTGITVTPNETCLSLGRLALKRNGQVGTDNLAKKTTIFASSPDRGISWEWFPLDTRDGGNGYSCGFYHTGLNKVVGVYAVEKGASGSGLEGADIIVRHFNEVDASSIVVANAGYETESQAVINLATRAGFTLPTTPQLNAWNTFIAWLKSKGLLTKADFLKILEFNNANCRDFGCLDILNPRAFMATRYQPTGASGYPNYSALGFKSNKTDNYLNLNWDPSIDKVNFSLNSACIMIGVSEAPTAGTEIGCYKTTGGSVFTQINLTLGFYILNSALPSSVTITTKTGLFGANRSASNATQLYQNGSSIASNTQASVSIPVGEWVLGGRATENAPNGNRVYDFYNDSRFEIASALSSLSAGEQADFNTGWTAYKTAIGL